MPALQNFAKFAKLFTKGNNPFDINKNIPIAMDGPGTGGFGGNLPREPLPSRTSPQLEMEIPGGNPTYRNPAAIGDIEETPDDMQAYDAFVKSALNPPMRGRLSPLRMLGTGLLSGLQTYDPSNPRLGFWQQFGNKPFDVEQAENIVNMPYYKNLADWKERNTALRQAAEIESQFPGRRALAEERLARTRNIPIKEERLTREGEAKMDIARRNADRQEYLASLNTLTDEQKINLLQNGRIELQDIRDANAMKRVERTGEQRLEQIGATGAERQKQIGQEGIERRLTQGMVGQQRMEQIAAGGEQARRTKVVVPGKSPSVTATNPSQVKIAQQLKAAQAIQDNPAWSRYIAINPNTGLVEITPPSGRWGGGPDAKTYDDMIRYMRAGGTEAPPMAISRELSKPAPQPQIIKQYSPSRNQTRISKDGGKTWTVVEGRQ